MDKKILIVDDDKKLRTLLTEYLEGYQYQVITRPDGLAAMDTISEKQPDMVILDIMMPERNGLDILKDIRLVSKVPIIMLTAKGEDTDRIVGLELGADDYIPKPFNPRELLARMKAIRRRTVKEIRSEAEKQKDLIIEAGGLILNRAKHTLIVDHHELELSSTEFKILEILMKHPNTVLSRDKLMSLAKGKDFMAFDRSIDVHISKLRSKLEPKPRSPKRIKTIWGTGYMFIGEEDEN